MRYALTHTTIYSYDEDVTNSFGIAKITPRELPHQHVERAEVRITPAPADQSTDTDFYGNTVTYFQVLEPHQRLEITASSEVEVSTPTYDEVPFTQPWERARPLADPTLPGAWRAADLTVASPLVEQTQEAYAFGSVSLTPQRELGEAAEDLMHRIHADFDYDDTATTVTSKIPEIFEAKGGVCQDFAHLMLACFRAHGLAARYVSGYLATTPPPGKPRLVGADASHAWVEVWLPHLGADLQGAGTGQWLALDPTNDTRADDRYVSVAWGRDYSDVSPVKGVIYTEATTSTLTVSVDVAPDRRSESTVLLVDQAPQRASIVTRGRRWRRGVRISGVLVVVTALVVLTLWLLARSSTPAEVTREFMETTSASTLYDLASDDGDNLLDGGGANAMIDAADGKRTYADASPHTLTRNLVIGETDVEGEVARVSVKISYAAEDGAVPDDSMVFVLVREGDEWRVDDWGIAEDGR